MGSTNYGNQELTYAFNEAATSQGFNQVNYQIVPSGIYTGFGLTILNNTTVAVAIGTAYLNDSGSFCGIRCQTTTGVDITVSTTNTLMVMRFTWQNNSTSSFVDFLAIAPGSQLATDVIIGTCVFSGSTLTGFDYTFTKSVRLNYNWEFNKTYNQNDIVIYQGTIYQSIYAGSNMGQVPTTATTYWQPYLFVTTGANIEWTAIRSYIPNNIVSYNGSLYVSLQNNPGNVLNQNPSTATAYWQLIGGQSGNNINWNPIRTYAQNDVVAYAGTFYVSQQNNQGNVLNQNPSTATAYWIPYKTGINWSSLATYNQNDIVDYNGTLYKSLQNSNTNQNPASVPTYWTTVQAGIAWNAASIYNLNDIVDYLGKLYLSINGTGNTNQNPSTAITFWEPYINFGQSPTKNYVVHGNFESQPASIDTNFPRYQNTAGITPISGTGGTLSGSLTSALNKTSPLSGIADAIFSKAAVSDQGEGWAYNFTLDRQLTGQPLITSFYYQTDLSGNYASGDVGFFVYDVTNSILIPTSVSAVPQSKGIPTLFQATWFPTTSTSYRLIWHITSTNALAWTFEVDHITTGAFQQQIGPAISGWTQYPMTIGATTTAPTKGTITTDNAQWRRVGSDMEITYNLIQSVTGAAAGSGTYLFSLPSGFTVDYSKLGGTATGNYGVGVCSVYSSTSTWEFGIALLIPNTSQNNIILEVPTLSSSDLINTYTSIGSTIYPLTMVIAYSFTCRIPIAQWTPNTNLATDFTEYASNSSATDANDTTSFVYESGGSAGIIGVTSLTSARLKRVQFQRAIQVSDRIEIEIYMPTVAQWVPLSNCAWLINGVYQGSTGYGIAGFFNVAENPTQLDVQFEPYSIPGTTYNSPGGSWAASAYVGGKWRVRKISNGNMAEQLPVIHFEGNSQPNVNATSFTIPWGKVVDTNNMLSSDGKTITIPVKGVYSITGQMTIVVVNTANEFSFYLYKNGANIRTIAYTGAPLASYQYVSNVSATLSLNAGDTIQIIVVTTSSNYATPGTPFYLEISRIGP